MSNFTIALRVPMPSFPSLAPLCGAPDRCSEPPRKSKVPRPFLYAIPSRAPSSDGFDALTAAEGCREFSAAPHALRQSDALGRQRARVSVTLLPPAVTPIVASMAIADYCVELASARVRRRLSELALGVSRVHA